MISSQVFKVRKKVPALLLRNLRGTKRADRGQRRRNSRVGSRLGFHLADNLCSSHDKIMRCVCGGVKGFFTSLRFWVFRPRQLLARAIPVGRFTFPRRTNARRFRSSRNPFMPASLALVLSQFDFSFNHIPSFSGVGTGILHP